MADKKATKKRNWAFILYPESAPSDWRELLQKTGLQCAISPFHDKDLDPTGDIKKAHYHIILAYSGPTSYNVVKCLTDSLNQPIPMALEQIRGYYRYFTHMDNPDKFQYDVKDISTINGFNIFDFIELTKSEVVIIKRQIHEFIISADIYEYCDLMDALLVNNEYDCWYEVASNNTLFFDRIITSRRNKRKVDT